MTGVEGGADDGRAGAGAVALADVVLRAGVAVVAGAPALDGDRIGDQGALAGFAGGQLAAGAGAAMVAGAAVHRVGQVVRGGIDAEGTARLQWGWAGAEAAAGGVLVAAEPGAAVGVLTARAADRTARRGGGSRTEGGEEATGDRGEHAAAGGAAGSPRPRHNIEAPTVHREAPPGMPSAFDRRLPPR